MFKLNKNTKEQFPMLKSNLCLVLFMVFVFQSKAQTPYSVEELPTILGDMKMNDTGKIVSHNSSPSRLSLLSNGVWQTIPSFTYNLGGVLEVNNPGTILAGFNVSSGPSSSISRTLRVDNVTGQFQEMPLYRQEYNACGITPTAGVRLCYVDCSQTYGLTINNSQQILANSNCYARYNNNFSFNDRGMPGPIIWEGLSLRVIPPIPSNDPLVRFPTMTVGNDINDNGIAVGKDDNRLVNGIPSRNTAVIWDATNGFRYLDSIIQTTPTYFAFLDVLKINNKGSMVVFYENQSGSERGLFLWDNNLITKIASGNQSLGNVNFNDIGEVVGDNNGIAYIWDKTNGLRNLNNLIPAGQNFVLGVPTDINNQGDILSYGIPIGTNTAKKYLLKKFRNPVIFVPGTLGSIIDGPPMIGIGGCSLFTRYWVNPEASTLCQANFRLTNDSRSLFYTPNLVATDALRTVSIAGVEVSKVYGPLLQMFVEHGFKEYDTRLAIQRGGNLGVCDTAQAVNKPNFFVFPYDFRQDNAQSSQKLKNYIQCVQSFFPPNTKIDIVAHSQGGLVTRRYILQQQAAGQPHGLRKVVTIASPFLGASEGMYKLETGGDWDASFSFGVITPPTIKFLVKHFPSAHQLLPSSKYFEFAAYDSDLLGAFYEIGDSNGNGIEGEVFDFNQTKEYLDSQFSTTPGTNGAEFHGFAGQDDWTQDQSGIDYNHIIASKFNLDTTVSLTVEKSVRCKTTAPDNEVCSELTIYTPLKGKGDGTVPYLSASRVQFRPNATGGFDKTDLNAPNSNRWYMWATSNQDTDETAHEHNGITQNPTAHQLILGILGLGAIPTGFSGNAELPPNQLSQINPVSNNFVKTSSPTPPVTYPNTYYLKLIGVSQAEVSDALGHHTAINGEIFTNNVSGLLSYEHIAEKGLFITMTTSQEHSVQFLMGNEPGFLEVAKGIGNKNPNNSIKYKDLALPAGTPIKITLTANGIVNFQYDLDRNGTFESTLQPTVNVSGVNARDTKPPNVNISAVQQGNIGTITITAQDSQSRLKNIKYSLNGTNNFVSYSQPFMVDASNPVTIYAYAEDNVFNRSPFAIKTLFATSVSIKGRVNVNNGVYMSSSRIFISLTKVSTGETFISKANQFGYYRFKNVAIGQNYIIKPIQIRNHSFNPVNKRLFLNSNLDNVDFTFDF
jgi:Lecithin:cholesterol acyltransferase